MGRAYMFIALLHIFRRLMMPRCLCSPIGYRLLCFITMIAASRRPAHKAAAATISRFRMLPAYCQHQHYRAPRQYFHNISLPPALMTRRSLLISDIATVTLSALTFLGFYSTAAHYDAGALREAPCAASNIFRRFLSPPRQPRPTRHAGHRRREPALASFPLPASRQRLMAERRGLMTYTPLLAGIFF